VEYFKPQGFCLDPCRGLGAFYDALPSPKDWCEIGEGRDFFTYELPQKVYWIITNTPWSAKEYRPIARRCFELADNVVLLVRLHNGLGTTARHNDYREFGHRIKEIIICSWDGVGFPAEGFALAVIHWQKGWQGDSKWTYWSELAGETAPTTTASSPDEPASLIIRRPTGVLRPFFHRFGSKWRIAPHYPEPVYDTIIEPFAGTAGFSLRYSHHQVRLFDLDPVIWGIWDYLIHVSEAEIMALPIDISHVDDLGCVPQEAHWLVGFWMNKGTTMPGTMASAWMRKYRDQQTGVYWSPEVRQRIASQLKYIRHWTIEQMSYEDIPDMRATWFIDGPYDNKAGEHYTYGRQGIDYQHLAGWCRSRSGQVIACENQGADWLDFRPFRIINGQRKQSTEVLWTNDGALSDRDGCWPVVGPAAILTEIAQPFQLFHGDCLTVLASLPEKSIDFVLTDLPCGVTACPWDSVIPLDKLWHAYRRVAKDTTAFVFTATQPFTTELINSCMDWFRCELIWEKPQGTNPLNAKNMPLKSHENVLVFYKNRGTYNPQMEKGVPYSGFVTKNGATIGEVYGNSKSIHAANLGTRYPKSILRFKQEREGLHPTQKPIPLMEYLIRTFSNEGDIVLDNCMGSGTTGVAAMNTKRRFIGIELDPEFFSTAEKRLAPFARAFRTR
jgi:DNA modification methylase